MAEVGREARDHDDGDQPPGDISVGASPGRVSATSLPFAPPDQSRSKLYAAGMFPADEPPQGENGPPCGPDSNASDDQSMRALSEGMDEFSWSRVLAEVGLRRPWAGF